MLISHFFLHPGSLDPAVTLPDGSQSQVAEVKNNVTAKLLGECLICVLFVVMFYDMLMTI